MASVNSPLGLKTLNHTLTESSSTGVQGNESSLKIDNHPQSLKTKGDCNAGAIGVGTVASNLTSVSNPLLGPGEGNHSCPAPKNSKSCRGCLDCPGGYYELPRATTPVCARCGCFRFRHTLRPTNADTVPRTNPSQQPLDASHISRSGEFLVRSTQCGGWWPLIDNILHSAAIALASIWVDVKIPQNMGFNGEKNC